MTHVRVHFRLQVAHKLAPGPLRDPRLAGLAQCESTKRVATWPTWSVRLLAVPLRADRSSCVLWLTIAVYALCNKLARD